MSERIRNISSSTEGKIEKGVYKADTPPARRLLTAQAVAELLGTRSNTVYELASRGELPSYRIPGVGRRFDADEVAAWLEGCRERKAPPARAVR